MVLISPLWIRRGGGWGPITKDMDIASYSAKNFGTFAGEADRAYR